jgi:cytochrome c biogenesis protein CcdA
MSIREALEKVVYLFVAIGFVAVAIGVGLWFLELAARFNLSLQATLVIGGVIVLAFGLLAAKLISRMES